MSFTINYIDGYDKLRKKLMDKVSGVKSEDNLSQEGAVKFLQRIDRIAANAKQKIMTPGSAGGLK